MNSNTRLNLVVALSAEAHPLIGCYKLKRVRNISSFEVYTNESMQLIVCGMGKVNAAVATGYLAGLSGKNAPQAWLNIGIGGGDAAKLGEMVIANSISDIELGKLFYPSLCFEHDLPQVKVVTVNEPNDEYQKGIVFDMEAAGFYAAANRFAPAELVHCCKIISDCSERGVDAIDKKTVISTVEGGLDKIEMVVRKLMEMVKQIEPDSRVENAYNQFVNKFHFTESQKHALKLYLQNWFALTNDADISSDTLENSKNTKELLSILSHMVDSIPVRY